MPKPETAPQPAAVDGKGDVTRITPTEAARLRWEIYKLHHQTNRDVEDLVRETDTVTRYVMQGIVPA